MEFDKDLYYAQVQRHTTFIILYGFLLLIAALLVAAFLPWQINDKVFAVIGSLVTAMLTLVGTAAGFWFNQRQQSKNSPTDVGKSQTIPVPQVDKQ